MLIWVSNWMINKSFPNKAWDEYIKKQTDASLSSGSLPGLAFISFLAVLREGAETILFYVPIVAAAGDKVHYVWIGLAVGLVALVVIYLLIQFAAVRIPLRPLLHHYLAADGFHGLHVHGFWYRGTAGGGRRVSDAHLRLPHH